MHLWRNWHSRLRPAGIYTACTWTDRKTAACDKLWLFRFPAVCHCLWHIVKKWLRPLRRISRFERYKRCIGTKALCAVQSLSGAVGLPEKKVQRELERMISQGYFLQGHMDDEKSCLILDDETYELYLHSKQQMERPDEEGMSRQ